MSETPYTVEVEITAAKALAKIQQPIRGRLIQAFRALATDPRPAGAVKLSGLDAYRVRVGDYRIAYTIEDTIRVVSVIRIGHRSKIYKEM